MSAPIPNPTQPKKENTTMTKSDAQAFIEEAQAIRPTNAARWRWVARAMSNYHGDAEVPETAIRAVADALVLLAEPTTTASVLDDTIDYLIRSARRLSPVVAEDALDATGELDEKALGRNQRGALLLVRMAYFVNGHPTYVRLDEERRAARRPLEVTR